VQAVLHAADHRRVTRAGLAAPADWSDVGEGVADHDDRPARGGDAAGRRLEQRAGQGRVGSSTRYRTMSATDSIDSLPIETSRLIPMLRGWAKLSTELARPPLCSSTPTGPRSSGCGMGSP
jgi:hypothetical protein